MQEIKEYLKNVIKNLYNLDFDPEIMAAPENIDADYSSNTPLKLAKELKKSPMQIAEEIVAWTGDATGGTPAARSREASTVGEAVAAGPVQSISAPGFLNFKLNDNYLFEQINKLNEDFTGEIASNEFVGKTVICEFSDPNPFKVLHVGHLYTSIVGDSISKLFEYAGAKVIRANFGGDVGLHVAKTMYILQQKPIENLTIEDIAKCYVEGTNAYETDETAKEEITKLNKEIYKINAEGITRTGDANRGTPKMFAEGEILGDNSRQDPSESSLADLYWKGRELSYEYFENFYNSIGVKFDKYYPESTVAALGLETVKRELENGVYEMSDGAVIFDGEKFGLHTRVFINKEGVPTYEAKDVGLIFTKWQDYHFDKSVIITASEQLEYMKVVLKSIEQYAPELVEKTSHLTHGLVKLPGNEKMSSRKGNFLKAVDVLDMVKNELKSAYDSSDEKVSLAATKYAFLKYKMGGDIIFDPKESVKMTGNSGPYLLYSAVRAKKILLKNTNKDSVENYIYNIYEKNLIKKILEYKNTLAEAIKEMAPHKIANYLYELAQEFSRFYENCQVSGSDEEQERLKLVKVYLDTMTHGLNILGIKIPEEM
ncbi:arginine--tRNA ligase [Candidatus Saccharibacteria bacterium]|nr:arginine--tRNA ligase [Candidatus Saccharibacteria bacterium]